MGTVPPTNVYWVIDGMGYEVAVITFMDPADADRFRGMMAAYHGDEWMEVNARYVRENTGGMVIPNGVHDGPVGIDADGMVILP